MVICALYGYRWLYKESLEEFGVLETLRMALGHKEDEGTHTHMMVIGHLDTYYTLGVDDVAKE